MNSMSRGFSLRTDKDTASRIRTLSSHTASDGFIVIILHIDVQNYKTKSGPFVNIGIKRGYLGVLDLHFITVSMVSSFLDIKRTNVGKPNIAKYL